MRPPPGPGHDRPPDAPPQGGRHHPQPLLIWISAARPGRTRDNTAARHDHILTHLRAAGLGALADHGFRGLDNDLLDPVIVTGYAAGRTRKPTPGEKEADRVLAAGRAPVERGFAHLKNWRTLTKLRTDPGPRPRSCTAGADTRPCRRPPSTRSSSRRPPSSRSRNEPRPGPA
ncbi:transposase family protein, partial [Streptomyces sp. WAC06614]|uniref:transposase family protein n=1 Tax=Streptomyces sp. WAC06614 TaxID=2487416 RepID=UPI0021B04CA7